MAAPAAPGEALGVPDDIELLRQAGQGNHGAFRILVERHATYLWGVAHALTANAHDAEDLVQETFIAALKGGFRGEASVRTWLVKILVRRAGMLRRTRWHRMPRVALDQAHEQEPAGGGEPNPAATTEARLDLSEMLDSLSPEHRQVIVLRELQGLSYEQIADALGVPRGTVESRLHRAREQLRTRYEGYMEK